MNLYALSYRPDTLSEPSEGHIGLAEVNKGLFRILQGYAICIGTVLGAVGLLCYVGSQVSGGFIAKKSAESLSTILFAGALILFLTGLYGLATIVRGKWNCLMSAPDALNAKWMMFGSIVCVLTGPALNLSSGFVVEQKQGASRMSKSKDTLSVVVRAIEDFKEDPTALDTNRYIQLAGDLAGLLSTVFFVLFLRAVALACNSPVRARLAEGYLLFTILLVGAVVVFLMNPARFLARPDLLLGLAGGWLLCGLWYFFLILNTISCIGATLSGPRSPLSAR